jgi:hypothetical protein
MDFAQRTIDIARRDVAEGGRQRRRGGGLQVLE